MNNNMNEQNNQGMNNTFPTNGSGTFVNNVSQQTNQTFANNNINQPTNQPFTNNNINQLENPPYNQTFTNNNFDNNNNLNQNNYNNINTPNYIPNNNGKNNNKTKKIIMILAIVLVVVVGISLLSKSSKTNIPSAPSAKRTLICTVNTGMAGVYYKDTYEYYINDGSLSLKQINRIDLKKTQLEGDVDAWAKQKTDSMSEECDSMAGCKFDYNYSKGNYLETTVFFSEEMFNEEVQGLTAEEIYEQQKARHEGGKIDGLVYSCSGNGATSTNTNNQSVYKTIDFNSYTGDSKSTEFDILMNKKVKFTNVPTLAGSLGNLTKYISCKNESSFTLEDDAKYTVTGIVTYNNGTYSVRLKDCTITKN